VKEESSDTWSWSTVRWCEGRLWNVKKGTPLVSDNILLATSQDGTRVLTKEEANISLPRDFGDEGARIFLAASPEGTRVLTENWGPSSGDDSAQVWDTESGSLLFALKVNATVNSAAFAPDGTRIVTAGGDLTPRLWDATSGKRIKLLKGKVGHERLTVKIAYSRDGERILTTSEDGTVRLWDATGTLTAILTIPGNKAWPNDARFSPDGTLVIATTRIGSAALWDAETGMTVDIFRSDTAWLASAAFSSDGTRVAIEIGHEGRGGAQIWHLSPPARGDNPKCLRLFVEFRTGLAWDDETKRPYPLPSKELLDRKTDLVSNCEGKFSDTQEWKDLTKDEPAALRGPGRIGSSPLSPGT
jgi:WD40 repeat protein